jgi:hypothetical protein
MEELPRHRTRHLIGLVLSALLAIGLSAAQATAADLDLIGPWHMLVHYTDDNTHNPDAWRWDDRVWVFDEAGSKIRWSEFPIVVFRDQTGRFGRQGTNRATRIIHAWEPNPAQQAQIEAGLEVNPRGKKSKSLRGSNEKGWESTRRRSSPGASVITYVEDWSIEGMPDAPVFQRADMMGSAMTESMEGLTRYAATEVTPDGKVISGTFERDGTRHGRFRMTRAGTSSDVKGSGKTQGQRLMDAWFGEFADAMRGDPESYERIVKEKIAPGEGKDLPSEVRDEIRSKIRTDIERSIRQKGLNPRDFEKQIDRMTLRVEKAMVEDGKSAGDIARMIEEGELAFE